LQARTNYPRNSRIKSAPTRDYLTGGVSIVVGAHRVRDLLV
jgi:hypothetical protein